MVHRLTVLVKSNRPCHQQTAAFRSVTDRLFGVRGVFAPWEAAIMGPTL